jgi:hypothetical protein
VVRVEVSGGELLDSLTSLRIKRERFKDEFKRARVCRELEVLERAHAEGLSRSAGLDELEGRLKEVSEELWDVEVRLRDCERAGDFGEGFERLGRSL